MLLFEANKKSPSGLGKVKNTSVEKDVEFIAGDIYDLGDNNRYIDKFSYYKGEGNGYIMDKDGNYYDVITKSWSSDAGRIAGGSMNYQVTIKRANGTDDAIFNGWSAIFSSPHYSNIIEDIKDGYYLEDYISKNWGALSNSEKFKDLKERGDLSVKSYHTEKEDDKARKEEEFNERYIILPTYVDFYIKNGVLEFKNFSPKKETEGKPEKSKYEIYRRDFNSDEEYEAAKEATTKAWSEYDSKLKEINKKLTDVVNKIASKLTEEYFKAPLSKLSGLEFSIIPKKGDNKDLAAIAIDTKKNKVVVLNRKAKKHGFDYTPWKAIDENPTFDLGPTAILRKVEASDYLKDLFKRVSDNWQKINGRTKTKYIQDNWEKIWQDGRGMYPWNPDKYTKKEAKEIAEKNFYNWLDKNNYDRQSVIEFFKNDITNFIKGEFPTPDTDKQAEKTAEEKPSEEKKAAPKFTGKLAEQEKKMDAWHNGTRKQNVEACSDAKLKVNYDICKQKGYDKEAELLKKEADARGLTLESLNLENIKLTLQDYIDLL